MSHKEADVYSALGDEDQAFTWLEKAFADRSHYLAVLRLEPLLDSLRNDPRWTALLTRVGV